MKRFLCLILLLFCSISLVACGSPKNKIAGSQNNVTENNSGDTNNNNNDENSADGKVLIIYFSATGTTKEVADTIQSVTQADLYEILAEDPYTDEDLAYYTGCRADHEQSDPNARPKIGSKRISNIEDYDYIFLGYPIWHGQAPKIIYTFLESYDLSNKTIIPFCTSHTSGLGNSAENLHPLAPNANWENGKRLEKNSSQSLIESWLDEMEKSWLLTITHTL